MQSRVFISGIGAISPFGVGKNIFWEGLIRNLYGITPYEPLKNTGLKTQTAGYVQTFNPKEHLSGINHRRMDRYSQFTFAAVKEAVEDAGINIEKIDPLKKGLIFSTIRGSYKTTVDYLNKLYQEGPAMVSPMKFSKTVMNAAATPISLKYQLKGISTVLSGSSAINLAYDYLKNKQADIIICGGVDVISSIDPFRTFEEQNMLSHKNGTPEELSRPADSRRNGFIYSEGAAFVILETEKSLEKRNGKAYAEIIGYGSVRDNNATRIFTNINEEPVSKSIKFALENSKVKPWEIDYINSMANSTITVDKAEAQAIKNTLKKNPNLSVSTFKGAIGETFGASESMGIIQTALTLKNQMCSPVTNLEKIDPYCNIPYVTGSSKLIRAKYAICNSCEVGGNIQTTVLKRVIE